MFASYCLRPVPSIVEGAHTERVRWEGLFAELESQADALEAAELASEVAERSRADLARLRLVDRLRPALGHQLTLSVGPGRTASGQARAVGPDWLLLAEEGSEALITLGAVSWLQGLPAASAVPGSEGRVAARLGLASALRGLVRDRAQLGLLLRDGQLLSGVLDRVGTDHAELAVTAPGEERRRGDVRAVRAVPLSALAVLRRR